MSKLERHSQKVAELQNDIKAFRNQKDKSSLLAFGYGKSHSNTTRTKRYKQNCPSLDFGQLNEIIHIDPAKRIAIVEPRVTMEKLLHATLPYHLAPPVLPEFKDITVGGAIMGGAGESGSHSWGCFNDICCSYEMIMGDGDLIHVSPVENKEIYYGIAGSYGSLGALVSTEIQLAPIQPFIYLTYYISNPLEAIDRLKSFYHSSHKPSFLDAIIFSQDLAIVMVGNVEPKGNVSDAPLFSFNSLSAAWFYQHIKELALEGRHQTFQEKMMIEDYFFRYDLGGFWMGALLFRIPFLARFISEGLMGFAKEEDENFIQVDIQRFHRIIDPPILGRTLLRPLLRAKNLWSLLHKAERWIQKRMMIQDFCIPESKATNFCKEILEKPAIFPIWLCPIKGTQTPQIFAPHFISHCHSDSHFINFGIYGIPSETIPISHITRKLELNVQAYGGRKALYSHSYYTEEEFWQIYSRSSYENLRHITKAEGMWHEITDKVLSA